MRNLFLFGDVSSNFCENIKEFLIACGQQPRIALLMINRESEKYEELYGAPMTYLSAGYRAIYPQSGELCKEDLDFLATEANGILMAGGYPQVYSNIYARGKAKEIISRRYYQGVPYAGVSARAVLTTERYEETTRTFQNAHNSMFLLSNFTPKISETTQSVNGFGFLKNIFLETHFSEWGLFPALLNKLHTNSLDTGIGFDETMGIKVVNESNFEFFGKGRAYIIKKKDNDFLLSIKEPSERYMLKEREDFAR